MWLDDVLVVSSLLRIESVLYDGEQIAWALRLLSDELADVGTGGPPFLSTANGIEKVGALSFATPLLRRRVQVRLTPALYCFPAERTQEISRRW